LRLEKSTARRLCSLKIYGFKVANLMVADLWISRIIQAAHQSWSTCLPVQLLGSSKMTPFLILKEQSMCQSTSLWIERNCFAHLIFPIRVTIGREQLVELLCSWMDQKFEQWTYRAINLEQEYYLIDILVKKSLIS